MKYVTKMLYPFLRGRNDTILYHLLSPKNGNHSGGVIIMSDFELRFPSSFKNYCSLFQFKVISDFQLWLSLKMERTFILQHVHVPNRRKKPMDNIFEMRF